MEINEKYQQAIGGQIEKAFSTTNSNIFRFHDENTTWLLKIYNHSSNQINEIEGNVAQKVAQLNAVSKLVKKYYQRSANEKDFFAIDGNICEITPEIRGVVCSSLHTGSEQHIEVLSRVLVWAGEWNNLTHDKLFLALPRKTQSHFRKTDFVLSNIIVTPENNYYIIDW